MATSEAEPQAPSSYGMHAGAITGAYAAAANSGKAKPTGWAIVTGVPSPSLGAEVTFYVADGSTSALGGLWRFSYDGSAFTSGAAPWCTPPGGVSALTSVGEALVWVVASGQRVWKALAGGEGCQPRELRALSLAATNASYTSVTFMLPSGAEWTDGKVEEGEVGEAEEGEAEGEAEL